MPDHPIVQLTEDQFKEVKFLLDRGLGDRNREITQDDLRALDTERIHAAGRMTGAERYQRRLEVFQEWKRTPAGKKAWDADNRGFKKFIASHMSPELLEQTAPHLKEFVTRDVSPIGVFTAPTVSSLSVQFANEDYIGEQLVDTIPTNKPAFRYVTYPQRERVQYPDDRMGSRGKANELHETRVWATGNCEAFGYSDHVDAMTLAAQDAPLDEMVDMNSSLSEGLLFRRELRIRNVLCVAGSYGANTWVNGAGTAWNAAGGGNPIADMQRLDAMLWSGRGPSRKKSFTSLAVYNVLARHAQILQLHVFSGETIGLATPSMIARYIGWDELLVGRAREDTAQEGAAATYGRIWEPAGAFFFGVVRVKSGGVRNAGFATLFRVGNPIVTTVYDPLTGHGGGYTCQQTVCESESGINAGPVIVAAACGALEQAPIV